MLHVQFIGKMPQQRQASYCLCTPFRQHSQPQHLDSRKPGIPGTPAATFQAQAWQLQYFPHKLSDPSDGPKDVDRNRIRSRATAGIRRAFESPEKIQDRSRRKFVSLVRSTRGRASCESNIRLFLHMEFWREGCMLT